MTRHALLLAAAAGLASLLGGCGGGGDAPPPAPPPSASYDLLFDNELADGSRRLQRAAPSGGVQSVGNGGAAVRPQASPDGRLIAFTSYSTDPTAVPVLMLLPDPARPPVVLSSMAGVYEREAVFSPDGRQVAFVSQRDEPEGADVFVATLNGTRLENVRNLTPARAGQPNGLDVTPAWSPDGTRIAFASNRSGGEFTLWVMNADGSNPRELTAPLAQADVFPTWSPDGSTLAFQRRSGAVYRIGLIQPGGGAPAFFDFDGDAFAPAWSPDGTQIAFVGRVNGEYDIHVRAPSGQGPVTRIANPGPDRNPAWIRRVPS